MKTKASYILTVTFIMITLIIMTIIISKMFKEARDLPNSQVETVEIIDTSRFKDSILNFIFELRLEHPYIVYSQAIIESGNFTSNIWRENNNMFGMKMPERRATLAIGINKGHSVYNSWKDCLIDYALFQSSYLRNLTEEEYFVKIGGFYAEDSSYERKIRGLKNSHKRTIR